MAPVYIADERQIESLLKKRRELELDLLDEVWEGTLHMSPPPNEGHQELAHWIAEVFRMQARRYGLGSMRAQVGMREPGTPTEGASANYRVPDIVVVPVGYDFSKGWVEDGALVVAEVRSPRAIVAAKLPFYAARGVAEILYVDWKAQDFELFRRTGDTWTIVSPDREGFCEIGSLSLRVRRANDKLEFEDARGGGPLPPI